MRIALIAAAALAVVPLGASAQDTAGRDLAASCAMCHGTDGRSVGGNEPLAGMAKDELVRKVKEFRTGAKPATIMHQISKGYSDQEIDKIAAFFAAQKK
jgi:cytochrome c553